ncbi:hypothetical protein Tco_0942767 [Tanacetum coccineum]
MSVHGYTDDEFYAEKSNVTLISRLDVSNPLHLHPNDSVALTVFDALIKLPKCTCHDADDFNKQTQLMKLLQFFMGLDDSYIQIRSSTISRETLPDVRSAYATIFNEESHMVASGNTTSTSQRS